MVVFPNAKINIGLEILDLRPDGFHNIRTTMVGVDWCDILEIVPGMEGHDVLHCSGLPVDCAPEKNLVIKAVKAIRDCGYNIPPVEVWLHKNIPDGAGLGGGSSDAAFTLKVLNTLFSLGLTPEELADIACRLGSDCPYFIYNNPMVATGRGEILRELDTDSHAFIAEMNHIVIVKPRTISVATAKAYAMHKPRLDFVRTEYYNDFEDGVFRLYPRLGEMKSMLKDPLGAFYASMSGSGSAIFGLFKELPENTSELSDLFPDCFIHVGKLLLS